MSNRFQFDPQIRTAPCLKGCGQKATYELVDPETQRNRATCLNCGVYYRDKHQVDDVCDAEHSL